MDTYIWKDINDPDTFMLGIKRDSGAFSAWTAVHVDGIWDLFGKGACEWIRQLQSGVPKSVQFTVGEM